MLANITAFSLWFLVLRRHLLVFDLLGSSRAWVSQDLILRQAAGLDVVVVGVEDHLLIVG